MTTVKAHMRLARNPLEVVARNPLGVVTRNPLGVVARKPHGIVARKTLGIVEKIDKIRPVGWITLTRFLFNRNIFPLTR